MIFLTVKVIMTQRRRKGWQEGGVKILEMISFIKERRPKVQPRWIFHSRRRHIMKLKIKKKLKN
jgi:hypothetical protein